MVHRRGSATAALLLATVFALTPAVASADVPTCQFGAYLTDLYDLKPADSVFSARVWVWALCPTKELDPLPQLTFPNSYGPTITSSRESMEAGHYRHVELLDGKFRQSIDEATYPFDTQRLKILITPAPNTDTLVLVADTKDTIASDVDISGWHLADFTATSTPKMFRGNLGDQTIPPNAGHTKSLVTLEAVVVRSDRINFIKVLGPLLLIFVIVAGMLVVATREAGNLEFRVAGLAALVFAVIVNMQTADKLAPSGGFSMLDQLHVVTLAWILAGLVTTARSFAWIRNGETARAHTFEIRTALVGSGIYLAFAALLIGLAATRR